MDLAEWMRTVTESCHGLVGSLRAFRARFFKLGPEIPYSWSSALLVNSKLELNSELKYLE
jgi:hypothetical protein